jgi:hypothetical protein
MYVHETTHIPHVEKPNPPGRQTASRLMERKKKEGRKKKLTKVENAYLSPLPAVIRRVLGRRRWTPYLLQRLCAYAATQVGTVGWCVVYMYESMCVSM